MSYIKLHSYEHKVKLGCNEYYLNSGSRLEKKQSIIKSKKDFNGFVKLGGLLSLCSQLFEGLIRN